MVQRLKNVLVAALLGFLTLLPTLASAQPVPSRYNHWWLPDEASTYAGSIDNMFYLILWVTLAVFVAVELVLVYFLFKYRYQKGRKAIYTHGNNKLEIIWTAIPAVILVFLAIFSNDLWSKIKYESHYPKGAPAIMIEPRQFQWDIYYAGPDKKLHDVHGKHENVGDDIASVNQLYLVKDKPVQIKLQGQDVIHSFFVPEFRIKQDAVPGMNTAVWITPTKEGEFEVACAELCGAQHYRMRSSVIVTTQDSVDAWLRSKVAQ